MTEFNSDPIGNLVTRLAVFYDQAYTVLVNLGGAVPSERDRCIHFFTTTSSSVLEWRFRGELGFGGKFWRNGTKHYVTCYKEDETKVLKKLCKEINEKLEDLQSKYLEGT